MTRHRMHSPASSMMRTCLCAALIALCVLRAAPAAAQSTRGTLTPAERTAALGYTLTMDKITQSMRLSMEAVRLEKADPAMAGLFETLATQSFADQVRTMEKQPKIVAGVRAAGFPSMRDYALASLAFSSALSAARMPDGMKQPPERPASDAQIAFVRAHKTEIAAVMKMATAQP